jgi:hypothetical protein
MHMLLREKKMPHAWANHMQGKVVGTHKKHCTAHAQTKKNVCFHTKTTWCHKRETTVHTKRKHAHASHVCTQHKHGGKRFGHIQRHKGIRVCGSQKHVRMVKQKHIKEMNTHTQTEHGTCKHIDTFPYSFLDVQMKG